MTFFKRLLASIYGSIAGTRGWLYDHRILQSYQSSLPVISVGNITAGGNGKTPLCLLIAGEMQRRGFKPAILSRGYGGTLRGPYHVSAEDRPEVVGDEPVLMAQSGFPVFISRSRVRGIRVIEARGDIDLVILDDGLQHRALKRDVDIVSIFAGSERAIQDFIKGALLPAGLFREKRDKALQRASLVVLSHRSVFNGENLPHVDERLRRLIPNTKHLFQSYLKTTGVRSLSTNNPLHPQRIGAFAAIANPEGFFDSLKRLGFISVECLSFRDHHAFNESELQLLLDRHPDLHFVCTAKDAVKLRGMSARIIDRCAVLGVEATVYPYDEFFSEIESLVKLRTTRPLR